MGFFTKAMRQCTPFFLLLMPYIAQSQCIPDFTFSPDSACAGTKIQFTDQSTGTDLNYTWKFGDSSDYDTVANPVHQYQSSGKGLDSFNVTLVISNTLTCKDSITKTVYVDPSPDAGFGFSRNDTVCSPATINFNNQSIGDGLNHAWNFGDTTAGTANTDSSKNPSFTYAHDSGTTQSYIVTLNTIDSSGCTDTAKDTIFVKPSPEAGFEYDSAVACGKDSINFQDSSTGNSLSYHWDFGGKDSLQNTSTQANPDHFYEASGNYPVTLEVTNAFGCVDTFADSVSIPAIPDSRFSVSNNCKGLPASFHDSSSLENGVIKDWHWDFGDGTTSNLQNPTHSYDSTGNFEVQLITTSGQACKDTVTDSITVHPKPLGTVSDASVCEGNSVSFTGDFSGNVSEYQWNYGDGQIEKGNKNTFHLYKQTQTYTPFFEVTFPDSTQCKAYTDTVKITELPQIQFSVTSRDTQCFANNQICIKDSTSFFSTESIQNQTILFGDGNKISDTTDSVKTFCHSYTQSDISYDVQVKVTNEEGCQNSKVKSNAINIRKKWQPGFRTEYNTQCFGTPTDFFNESGIDSSDVKSFKWDFGDGSTDTSRWNDFTHTYNDNGAFQATLSVTGNYGCTKQTSVNPAGENVKFSFDVSSNKDTFCFSGNNVTFSQTPIDNANFLWDYGDGSTESDQVTNWTTNHQYSEPGRYLTSLKVSKGQCDTTYKYDTVWIIGVQPVLNGPINQFQCEIDTPVIFVDSIKKPYASNHYGVPNGQRLWDFGDTTAPACTTNTSKGINVNKNCRYSRDSIHVSHEYPADQPGCFTTSLMFQDTVSGCSSSTSEDVALQRPNAGPDSTQSPPLQGAQFSASEYCLGPEGRKTVEINLDEVQPTCKKDEIWVMWDSACARQSGNFSDHWEQGVTFHTYDYDDKTCDSQGYRTVGLVVKNGNDSSDQPCYDTFWYHNAFRHNDFDPRFSHNFDPSKDRCPPVSVTFQLKDTIRQDSVTSYEWKFDNDTTITKSKPDPITYTFKEHKKYVVRLTLNSSDGCTATDTVHIPVGFDLDFGATPVQVCKGEQVNFKDSIRYWHPFSSENYWQESGRPEQMQWDFGDGKGFSDTNFLPSHAYDTIGLYDVRLTAQDSSGCRDTLTRKDFISVYGVNANFTTGNSSLICTPEVTFQDKSTFTDSGSGFKGHGDDSATSWQWQFGDGKEKSLIQNPSHNYTQNDTFKVQMKVSNTAGCQDSISKTLALKGPNPKFRIASDSVGCPPVTTVFDNQSTDASSYIWEFGNPGNNVLSTNQDTNVRFTYEEAGTYNVFLVAQDSVKNPATGSEVFCSATYPDTSIQSKTSVNLKERATPDFTFTTQCDTTLVQFQDNSAVPPATTIDKQIWHFDTFAVDSGSSASFDFNEPGKYDVKLITHTANGCQDSISKTILVPFGVKADFTYSNNCANQPVQLFDTSKVDSTDIQSWEWSFGDGSTSFVENPEHTYSSEGDYTVQLISTSQEGCKDTIAKTLTIEAKPFSGFTVNNPCNGQDVALQNNSSISSGTLSYEWHFGDGTSANTQTPSKTYANTGSYSIDLIATSDNGCKDTANQAITINATPQSQFNAANTCEDSAVQFSNNSTISSGSISNYHWAFGDGTTSGLTNPNHEYASEGTYTTTLIATSDQGCEDTASQEVQIYPKPQASMTFSNACEQDTVKFQNNSTITSGSLSSQWDFGDGTSSNLANPEKPYASDGNYVVELIITSDKVCQDTTNQTITIHAKSQPDFAFNNQCKFDTVDFKDQTSFSGGSLTYSWEFGDGNTASKANPVHAYNTAKTFNPQLTVTTDKGCQDSVTKSIDIHPLPQMAFDFSNGCEDDQIQFTNNTSIVSGTLSHDWDFGNGKSATQQSPSVSYSNEGTYNVQLISSSNKGCKDSLAKNVTVYPRAEPSFSFADTCENDTLQFINNSTVSSGSMTFDWDFGDGDSAEVKNPQKAYDSNQTYPVMLHVTTDKGCKDSLSKSIDIFPRAVPAYTFTNNCEGDPVSFNNQTSVDNGTLSYNWYFDDGSNSSQTDPNHAFAEDQDYNVRLKVTTDKGCQDSITQTVHPHPRPEPRFTFTNACLNKSHQFTDLSSLANGTMSYDWDFGDGNSSTNQNPSHVYPNAGYYIVDLTVTSDEGCQDKHTDTVEVYPKPKADFSFTNKCFPQALPFNDQSSVTKDSITQYHWGFGDGSTSADTNPDHQYSNYGDYNVTHIVTTNHNCKDTVNKQVTSFAKPNAGFSAKTVCYPNPTPFKDQTTLARGTLSQWEWAFGDNSKAVNQNPDHQYPEGGQYNPELIATTNEGCKDTVQKSITVDPEPKPGFAFNDTCLNQPTQFNDTTSIKSGTIQSRKWQLGDDSSKTGSQFTYVYPDPGDYAVQLNVTSDHGCEDSVTQTVTVDHLPKAGFTHDTVCYGFATTFNDTSSVKRAGLDRWEWAFGDGDTSHKTNPGHAYPEGGNYQTRLVVESDLGCLDTFVSQAEVFHKPKAGYSANEVCYPRSTQFTDTSSVENSRLINWEWQFDDGATSNQTNPRHAYSAHGIYQPVLEVESDKGCLDTVEQDIIVHAKPEANFQFGDTCQPFPVNFRNSSSVDTGEIIETFWQFGDNQSGFKENPDHRFPDYGEYQTRLVVTTNEQCKDTVEKNIETFPKPDAGFSTENVCLVDTAEFQDSSKVAAGTVNQWEWDFADGDTAIGLNPQHKYTIADTYDVREIVTTDRSCQDTAYQELIIYPMPQTDFAVKDSIQCLVSNDFEFTNQSAIKWGTMDYLWHTAVGDSSRSTDFSRVFEDFGDFDVSLKATSDHNCEAAVTKTMHVYPDPVADFDVQDGCTNAPKEIFDKSRTDKGMLTDWYYDFGDDSSSRDKNPEHNYRTRGDYTVTQIVQNNAGCDDTAKQTIKIYGKPGKAKMKRVTVVADSFNHIEWEPVEHNNPGVYSLYRSNSRNNLGQRLERFRDQFQFNDYEALVDSQPYYYHIWFNDSCGNPYPHETFGKTIHLNAEIPLRFPELNFNKYEGWEADGVDYYQVQWSDSPYIHTQFQNVAQTFTPGFKDEETRKFANPYCYRVMAFQNGSDSVVSVSNVDCIETENTIYVPNAFSPNGDGHNDEFRIKGSFVIEYELKIFNRWGELLFESNNQEKSWDGTYQREPVPTGIYIYELYIKGPEKGKLKNGTIRLIR